MLASVINFAALASTVNVPEREASAVYSTLWINKLTRSHPSTFLTVIGFVSPRV